MATYLVTAHHPVPKYNLVLHPATVEASGDKSSGDKFYCTMATLGCGKDYATPRDAILGLVHDHAYYNVTITEAE